MPELPPILVAGLTGLISGLLLSIPVGPINLTILNEGARRGFKWGALIGLGATTMEVIYCFIAFTSFASFFTGGWVKLVMEVFSFFFVLFIGVKFLLSRTVHTPPVHWSKAADRFEARLQTQLQPHSAFMMGLVRVMGNLGVLVFWVVLAANFISREWVSPDWPGKLACVGGVAVGNAAWFTSLSWAASLGQGKLSEKKLLRIEHWSGAVLVLLALIDAGYWAWRLYHKH